MASLAAAVQPNAAASSPQAPVAEQHIVSVAGDDVTEVTSAEGASTMAIVPFRKARGKPKVGALLEKHLAEHEGKSTEERLAIINDRRALLEARIKEEVEGAAEQCAPVEEARSELEEEKGRVAEAIKEELAAALAFRACKGKRDKLAKLLLDEREQMLEAQKKIAMMQVVQENHAAMERLKQQRAAALQAVQDAKKSIMEHRLQEKRVLEEAKRGVASSRAGKRTAAAMVVEEEVGEGEGHGAVKHAKHSEMGEGNDGDAEVANIDDDLRAAGA